MIPGDQKHVEAVAAISASAEMAIHKGVPCHLCGKRRAATIDVSVCDSSDEETAMLFGVQPGGFRVFFVLLCPKCRRKPNHEALIENHILKGVAEDRHVIIKSEDL